MKISETFNFIAFNNFSVTRTALVLLLLRISLDNKPYRSYALFIAIVYLNLTSLITLNYIRPLPGLVYYHAIEPSMYVCDIGPPNGASSTLRTSSVQLRPISNRLWEIHLSGKYIGKYLLRNTFRSVLFMHFSAPIFSEEI